MLRSSYDLQVFLYIDVVDMRKSLEGLAALVEQELELNPIMHAIFLFCNRGREKTKLLHWECSGLCALV